MPTIMTYKGMRFYFYSKEGTRPHIHIKLAEYETQIWLDNLTIKKPCKDKQIQEKMIKITEKHKMKLLAAWEEYFK